MANVYEVNDGDTLEAIESLCRHIATPNGFGTTTHPTLDEVRRYLEMAYYRVAGYLTAVGYNVTQSATTAPNAVGWLSNLQAMETAILIEMAYPVTSGGRPNVRFTEFINQRDLMVQMLFQHIDLLSDMGAVKGEALGQFVEVTGTSRDRKQGIRDDSDFVPYRFNRGWGSYPGTPTPGTTDWGSDRISGSDA